MDIKLMVNVMLVAGSNCDVLRCDCAAALCNTLATYNTRTTPNSYDAMQATPNEPRVPIAICTILL